MALSVLEKEENKIEESEYSRIKRNYAMLINPELKAGDLLGQKYEEQAAAQAQAMQNRAMQVQAMQAQIQAMKAQSVRTEEAVAAPAKPYLVENARADSQLFRADSAINLNRQMPVKLAQADNEDEENEDLRPTPTTIQYRTTNMQNTTEEGVIQNKSVEKRSILSKREKIIIAAVVGVFIMLFALIIINSAIISNISNDIEAFQSSLTVAKEELEEVNSQYNAFMENVAQTVEDFAKANGMVK